MVAQLDVSKDESTIIECELGIRSLEVFSGTCESPGIWCMLEKWKWKLMTSKS
jgi:hypothetical protein